MDGDPIRAGPEVEPNGAAVRAGHAGRPKGAAWAEFWRKPDHCSKHGCRYDRNTPSTQDHHDALPCLSIILESEAWVGGKIMLIQRVVHAIPLRVGNSLGSEWSASIAASKRLRKQFGRVLEWSKESFQAILVAVKFVSVATSHTGHRMRLRASTPIRVLPESKCWEGRGYSRPRCREFGDPQKTFFKDGAGVVSELIVNEGLARVKARETPGLIMDPRHKGFGLR